MQLFTPKHIDDVLIPNKKEWCSFYQQCMEQNDLNIACVGPRDSCKSTLLNIVIQDFIRDHNAVEEKNIVYRLSIFDDVPLQTHPNLLTIFCQAHKNHDKLVYIDRFDEYNDQNQQLLKGYMDKYNLLRSTYKVHFLIEATQPNQLKDIIKSRMNIFHTQPLTFQELHPIFRRLCETRLIQLNPNIEQYFNEKDTITVSSIRLFLKKMILLKQKEVDCNTLQDNYDCMDMSIFKNYLESIENGDISNANALLFDLHDKGYDLSDIYYYLYEYIKNNNKYVHCIGIICDYINQHYNGHYNGILILFLTNDIQKKIST